MITLYYFWWSGRPGQLPAQAPHRSGLAQLTHPALQATDSLSGGRSFQNSISLPHLRLPLLSAGFSLWGNPKLYVSVLFPPSGSVSCPPLRSTGSFQVSSPASSLIWDSPNSWCPFLSKVYCVHLPRYHYDVSFFAPEVAKRCLPLTGVIRVTASPTVFILWEHQDFPSSWGTPMCTCPALRPRWTWGPGLTSVSQVLPSVIGTTSASTIPFSRLNHTACALPVYALRRQ